jgi:GH15 family glucan-1,4-alpha-glucosidase
MSASRIAQIVGKQQDAEIFQNFAKQIRTGIMNHMFDAGRGIFIKQLARNGNEIIKDKTVDISSIFGVIRFGIINPDDPRIPQFLATVEQILSKNVTVGGIIRYENDQYYRRSGDETSNPWFITTLWLSQLYIMHAKKIEDFHERTFKTLQWCIKFAQSSGMLSEQIDPHTGAMLSVSPLTWSHAEFVTTILDYVEKMTELGIQFPIINGKRLPFTTQWQSSHS